VIQQKVVVARLHKCSNKQVKVVRGVSPKQVCMMIKNLKPSEEYLKVVVEVVEVEGGVGS